MTALGAVALSMFAMPAHAEPSGDADLQKLLVESDLARGGGIPGIRWTVTVKQFDGDEEKEEIQVDVKASSGTDHLHARLDFTKPAKYRDRRMLLRDHNMWFIKDGLRKPVPISTRQRLSGSAANADIASANYAQDYSAKLLRTEDCGGEPCVVLELTARSDLVTYPKIEYWVVTGKNLGKKARFYGASGKALKEAFFEYSNRVTLGGVERPFVSRVSITDELAKNERTELSLSAPELGEHKRSTFLVESL
ncbi:outer membrane lipoprotein-sorting protein [Myxococcota bacterium]|nr:outer membrane lipoprotein-sorting protein [Myxococcota bacterium]